MKLIMPSWLVSAALISVRKAFAALLSYSDQEEQSLHRLPP